MPPRYAELHACSNFSFLRGASHPDELVQQAHALGLEALALTDHGSLAGVVRAHLAAKPLGLKLIIGARLDPRDGPPLLAYAPDRAAYGRLSSLLTLGKRAAPKGACHLSITDVAAHAQGLIFATLASHNDGLPALAEQLGAPLYYAVHPHFDGRDRARFARAAARAQAAGLPLLATNAVLYHSPARRALQDVLTCIREHVPIHAAGYRLEAHAERHLKSAAEMARLFAGYPAALAHSVDIAQACQFSLDELVYEYPDDSLPPGADAQLYLEELVWAAAAQTYPAGVPPKVMAALRHELSLIGQLRYAPYFLTVHDIVRFARSQGILCQGRGSAANSAVCYVLGITAVDPAHNALLFERFISPERKEPPDIDVDFEHERREEVIQYIYSRYGRDRAGIAATVICYRPRSAIREVGKAMGLSEDITGALAGTVWGSWGTEVAQERVREAGLDPSDPLLGRTLALANELVGFPRHLSQHVGGFILTRGPLAQTVPIGNAAMPGRTFIEWDKDDIDALGILKVDVLALGMLSCVRKSFDLLKIHKGLPLTLASLPKEDAAVYDMLCRADSLGVFQVESRAQMNMLPRLKPRCFYDLVIEVAIVRPGPIQGDMVHPFLRRRSGHDMEVYPAPAPEHGPPDELREILGRTRGVPLFQEQAMRIAMVAARFTPDEVNQLRHSMATFRKRGTIGALQDKMVAAMVARGYDPGFAERCFQQIKGFGEYGFPESHAASFALLVYVSAWLKCHHPDVFCAALLNSQPMGFYAPAQIVRDAREHGVQVLPPDVSVSDWDCTLEPARGRLRPVRLGLRLVSGLPLSVAQAISAARPFRDLDDMQRRAGLRPCDLEALASADALGRLAAGRRAGLWAVKGLSPRADLPLFEGIGEGAADPAVCLPAMATSAEVIDDYRTLALSLKGHPLAFLRAGYAGRGVLRCADLAAKADGARVDLAGVVLVRQKPGSAKGVCFMTIEDESGIANLVIWPTLLEKFRPVVMGARLIYVRGRVQRHQEAPGDTPVLHVVAAKLEDWTADLAKLSSETGLPPLARADEVARPVSERPGPGTRITREPNLMRHPREAKLIPRSRDFH
jgi:error-prone DNA polymerase